MSNYMPVYTVSQSHQSHHHVWIYHSSPPPLPSWRLTSELLSSSQLLRELGSGLGELEGVISKPLVFTSSKNLIISSLVASLENFLGRSLRKPSVSFASSFSLSSVAVVAAGAVTVGTICSTCLSLAVVVMLSEEPSSVPDSNQANCQVTKTLVTFECCLSALISTLSLKHLRFKIYKSFGTFYFWWMLVLQKTRPKCSDGQSICAGNWRKAFSFDWNCYVRLWIARNC